MSNFEIIGRWLLVLGLALAVIGGLVWGLGRLGVNQLPGTLRINIPGGTCVIPLLASIVLSIVLTLVLNLLARFLNR